MDIVIEQSKMVESAKELTYQNPFPLHQQCQQCWRSAMLIMLVNDKDHLLVAERPPKVDVWPHDATAIAIYLCTECGEMQVEWNQS